MRFIVGKVSNSAADSTKSFNPMSCELNTFGKSLENLGVINLIVPGGFPSIVASIIIIFSYT